MTKQSIFNSNISID